MTDPLIRPGPDNGLTAWLAEHEAELVAVRRHLHSHPELSWQEHETTQFIAERLDAAGLASQVFSSGTGLVCDVEGAGAGPTVALRGDIDALAMNDEKNVDYCSQNPGVAHACGHDVHTTIVLAIGLYLAQLEHPPAGTVRLLFQPAEERVPGGACQVIEDGALAGVDAIFGVHCDPKLEVGRVGIRPGPITSAADMMEIAFAGPGGHTARPEQTVDMVALAARVVRELPVALTAALGEGHPVKVVFGSLISGEAANVIPTHALLRASLRTPSESAWESIGPLAESIVEEMAFSAGAACNIEYVSGVPPVANDDAMTAIARRAAVLELGPDAVTEAIQSWGGDDFAWYLREVPGSFLRLGVHDPAAGAAELDLHAGHFDADERAIGVGVRVLLAAIRELTDSAGGGVG